MGIDPDMPAITPQTRGYAATKRQFLGACHCVVVGPDELKRDREDELVAGVARRSGRGRPQTR